MQLLTLGGLRKETGISFQTLRRYADAGWIECEIDSSGRRIFTPDAVDQALRVFESRTSRKRLVA
jgi:DNA-binding transcriptional MerR regulator